MKKNQKIAFVSGGNRGIGKAICRALIQKGFAVILGARDLEKAKLAMDELQDSLGAGRYIEACQIDLTDEASMSHAAQWVEKEYGRLDVLINNAGILPNTDNSTHTSAETLDHTLRTNLYGPMLLSQKMLPLLRRSDSARIINISSGMGSFAEMGGGYTAYRLSKAALNALTATMAVDLKLDKIKVMSACPGWVQTDMGGQNAPRTPEQAASGIAWLAISPEAQSGKFYRDGKELPW